MRDRLQAYLRCVRRLSLNGNAGSSEPVSASQPVASARPSPELEFTSRGAAILALRRSLEFLQSSEPTSPVVFLLHYALEVADRPFLGLYGDWASPELTTLKDKLGLEESVVKRLTAAAPPLAVPVTDETMPAILSRDEALRALRAISAYLVATDRSNPVPTILNQALELSGMSFGEIWARFAPEQIREIRYILGAPRPPKEVSP
jgi:predicted component of type VI protein secretion system